MRGLEPKVQRLAQQVAAAVRRLRPVPSWRSATLWLIVAVNVVLILLCFWSRGGATTTVRIEAIGSEYRAFVDGKLVAAGTLQGREEGGVGFDFSGEKPVPSLPGPTGVDSVVASEAATGEVIFEDTFSGSQSDLWVLQSGDWKVRDGVFSTTTQGLVTTGFQPWGDYVLEAKLRNPTGASIYVRMHDSDNAVIFSMRPFRHYNSSLRLKENGTDAQRVDGAGLQLDRGQTIQSITAMLLRPYGVALLMVAGIVVLAFAVRLPGLETLLHQAGQSVLEVATPFVLVLSAAAFAILLYLNYVVGEAMPHVPDSVGYVFQSKFFASFRITADPPPVQESFSFFRPHFLHVVDGRWFSQYPFGHPLFLAVGQFFHAVWLVPPVLGAASVFLIYRVGAHVYDTTVGVLAAVLLFFSPFFQMTASNFMSHNTAVFVILVCLFLLVRPSKRRLLSMFFSGVFLGLLFNIRPLVGVAFIPVLGGLMGYELLRAGNDRRKELLREDLAFAAGALVMLLAYFGYNQATSGDFLTSPYAAQGTFGEDTFGFGGSHSVAFGLQNEQELLAFMLLVANGWPIAVGFVFAAIPFLLGTRHRWDYFLGASFLALAAGPMFYKNAAVMHGPRFWYETMPFLTLLTARGVQYLREAGPAAGDWLARRFSYGPPATSAGITGLALLSLVAGLVAFSAYGWMLGRHEAWSGIESVPQKMSMLEGFNHTDRRLLDRADEMNLENALVVVENCSGWWCFGSVFWTNSPLLDSDVVWAEQQGTQDDLVLLDHFQGRNLYLADYNAGDITPVSREEIAAGIE